MTLNLEELSRAELVLDSIRDEWIKRPGVTAIDIGFKWQDGEMTDRLSIRVHVATKKNPEQLSARELFPKEIEGFPVDVIEASYAPQTVVNAKPEMALEGRGKRYSVIPLGVSVGGRFATAGTLGAKVIDNGTGEEMILSNWHVLAGRQDVEAGMEIWQPGWIDGGTRRENKIAELSRWVIGPYDAAVARITGPRKVESKTVEGSQIEDNISASLGMRVWKSGRSTGKTEGFIDGMSMTVPLYYPGLGMRLLEKVFRIIPRPGDEDLELSIGGDSGAVWVDEASGKAVGLHFAGEVGNSPEHALAHEIGQVLDHLEVKLPAHMKNPPSTVKPPVSDDNERHRISLAFWQRLSEYLRKWLGVDI